MTHKLTPCFWLKSEAEEAALYYAKLFKSPAPSINRMPVAEGPARAAAGEMTVDASLVTLDFALRHQLLPAAEAAALAVRAAPLWQGPSRLGGATP